MGTPDLRHVLQIKWVDSRRGPVRPSSRGFAHHLMRRFQGTRVNKNRRVARTYGITSCGTQMMTSRRVDGLMMGSKLSGKCKHMGGGRRSGRG